ncbi:MAG: transcriptional regulator, partial [Prevotella sp.]|nr:transcriptional regulator [Prevotella sp.]
MKGEYIHSLSDDEIVEGLRNHDSIVTREYFYQYCRIAYAVNDRRYDLANKPGLDFYSIAHEYYLSLEKNGFRQLDDRNSDVSLKTWMINGFRFVLLDRLKAYKTEFGKRSVEERIDNMCKRVSRSQLHFDVPDDSYRKAVRDMVEEVCNDYYGRDDVTSI